MHIGIPGPVLKILRKLRLREVICVGQGHTARNAEIWKEFAGQITKAAGLVESLLHLTVVSWSRVPVCFAPTPSPKMGTLSASLYKLN